MNSAFKPLIILALGASVGFSACNSSTEDDEEYINKSASSTLVTAVSLKPNYKLLTYLDSVYFSIDQVKAEIFNADSLPFGTDVRKLCINYTLAASGGVEIIMPNLTDGRDTVINLVDHPNDSINFSRGQVWMRVTSADQSERLYSLKVNVHKINADSLQWCLESGTLPLGGSPAEAAAVEFNSRYYMLRRNASGVSLATADTPGGVWAEATLTGFPANGDVNSLRATTSALYILDTDGTLYSSTDGLSWSACDHGWSYLYGQYASEIIGVKDSRWVLYPSGITGDIPAEMPVRGTSPTWTFTNEWAIQPQAMFVGGIKADGSYTGICWGFDGSAWAPFSNQMGTRTLPAARGMQLFPYFTFRTGSKWFDINKHSVWIALGGITADGNIQRDVYYSLDNGINWLKAPQSLQLPNSLTPRADASVMLCDHTFSAARAVTPITEWNAPYIYLFGGYAPDGRLYNQRWSGVINRLTFKPLQ